jgi:hypothetical protein
MAPIVPRGLYLDHGRVRAALHLLPADLLLESIVGMSSCYDHHRDLNYLWEHDSWKELIWYGKKMRAITTF